MSRESAGLRVIVIGGSLGGLNAALSLIEIGCDVDVYERSPVPLQDRGGGIVLNPATIRYLVQHDVVPIDRISADARSFRSLNPDGSFAHEEPCQYRFTAYHALYRSLLQAMDESRYHLGEECTGFEQRGEQVVVHFAGGRTETCDLLVCADGINSVGRRQLFPDVTPQYAGYVAWRGIIEESSLSREAFDVLHAAISYVLLDAGHVLAYPIPNRDGTVEIGRRLTNWLWYQNVPLGDAFDDLMTDRQGQRQATSLPPQAVQERHVRRLREQASDLAPAFAEMITKTEDPFIQVIFDIEVPRMRSGKVCVIGDAAFTARPHAGAGTAKAAEDGWQLAQAIRSADDDIERALAGWEAAQLQLGRQLVARSREAGNRLQRGRWRADEPLPFGLYEVGDSVLSEELRGSA